MHISTPLAYFVNYTVTFDKCLTQRDAVTQGSEVISATLDGVLSENFGVFGLFSRTLVNSTICQTDQDPAAALNTARLCGDTVVRRYANHVIDKSSVSFNVLDQRYSAAYYRKIPVRRCCSGHSYHVHVLETAIPRTIPTSSSVRRVGQVEYVYPV